jgi:ferredoxin
MPETRVDLFARYPALKAAVKSRLWQPIGMLLSLFFFVLAILTGLLGTPAGARNFAIIFVWIVWWGLLIVGLVPLFGRLWCAVCPIPAPGEWVQRRSIVRCAPGRLRTLGWKWPRTLRNIWLQNLGFLLVALFSALILTLPSLTAWMLLSFIVLGTLLSVAFEGRIFCRFVCPVGGFIGLYALASPLELRVKDACVCKEHATKECLVGSSCSYGCPWLVYPGGLQRNAHCGLCGECLRACSRDNIALNVRPFGSDLFVPQGRRLDEAYKAFIMLSCALVYSTVLIGPWGWLKDWANMKTAQGWGLYAVGFLAVNLLVVPGLFLAATAVSRRVAGLHRSLRQLFVDYAYALVPLGLAAWVAFSLSFVLVNGSYAAAVVSDPFGWGWDLFGTAGYAWQPLVAGAVPILQVAVLILGLVFSTKVVYRIAHPLCEDRACPELAERETLPENGSGLSASRQAWWASVPVALFMTGMTLLFIRIYLG